MSLSQPLLVIVLVSVSAACSDAPRIGVVDVQQAFQRSPLVMVAALELKGELGAQQRDLQQRGRALAELRRQLHHSGALLSPEQREGIEARVAEETARLVELQQSYRAGLAEAQKRRGEELIETVESVAREVARREGLSLLTRRDAIIYAEEGIDLASIDITEQVVRALLEKINPTEIPEPAE